MKPRIPPAIFLAALLITFAGISAHAQVFLDFETENQFTDNFTRRGSTTSPVVQSSNGAANDQVEFDISNSTTTALVFEFTGTPSLHPGTPALTVSFDFRAPAANSSFGIYLVDPEVSSNNMLTLFNQDASGSQDLVRFYRDAANVAAGQTGTQVGSNQTPTTSANADNTFNNLSLTMTVSGTTPTLDLTIGGTTYSQAYAAGDFDFTGGNVKVFLRLFDGANTSSTSNDAAFDNFAITPVPEPSVAALALTLFPLLALRRRQLRSR